MRKKIRWGYVAKVWLFFWLPLFVFMIIINGCSNQDDHTTINNNIATLNENINNVNLNIATIINNQQIQLENMNVIQDNIIGSTEVIVKNNCR